MPSARLRRRRSSRWRTTTGSPSSSPRPPWNSRTRCAPPSGIARPMRSRWRRTDVPAYPREELEEMWQRWLDTNKQCEANRDWRPLADMYAVDATYGWNSGPNDEFMAMGREEIRNYALGLEMHGLEGWTYPYQAVLIDDRQGMLLGLWKQVSEARRDDGSAYEVAGLGGSWFGYAGA